MKRPYWGILLVAGCARIGCPGDDRPIVYVDLVDEASQVPGAPAQLKRALLEEAMRDVMKAWPGYSFRKAEPDEVPWQVDLRIVFMSERPHEDGAKGAPTSGESRSVGVRMRLKALRPSAVKGEGNFETEFVHRARVAAGASWSAVAAEAVRRTGEDLGRTVRLARASPEEVLRALGHDNERVRARAAVVAGTRKLQGAVPRLMEIVRAEDEAEQVVLRSIGALVAIRDPRAASALIDAGRRRSSAYVAQIVFALGELGGREAEAYLFTVASGHPNPGLRQAAQMALDGLKSRGEASVEGEEDVSGEPEVEKRPSER